MTGTPQPDVFVEEALRWSSAPDSQKVWHVWRWNDEQHKTTAIADSQKAARSLARQWAALIPASSSGRIGRRTVDTCTAGVRVSQDQACDLPAH
jgi:hypothetical protein